MMRKAIKNKRGYIIAEAAILMPVFLFSVVLLIYMVKIVHFQEIVHFEASENLIGLASQYRVGGASFGERMYESRVYHDVQGRVEKELNIEASVRNENEVYIADISYPISLKLPFGLYDDIFIRELLACRRWSGADNTGEAYSFDAMRLEDDGRYVYIFPRYGERYHDGGCIHLAIDGRYFESISASEAALLGYSGCMLCQ